MNEKIAARPIQSLTFSGHSSADMSEYQVRHDAQPGGADGDEIYGAFLVEHDADADRDSAGNDCFRADPKPANPENTPAEDFAGGKHVDELCEDVSYDVTCRRPGGARSRIGRSREDKGDQ